MMNDKVQSVRLPGAKIRLKFNGKVRFTIWIRLCKGYTRKGRREVTKVQFILSGTAEN